MNTKEKGLHNEAPQQQHKDNKNLSEIEIFYKFLLKNVCTGTMTYKATDIPQKHITRYKRKLEKNNLLFVAYKGKCKITGRANVQYITTNPELIKSVSNRQLKLF